MTIIQNAICNGFRPLVRAPFMFSMALFLSIKMNAKLALIFIVVAPILGIGLFFIVKTLNYFDSQTILIFRHRLFFTI